MEVTLTPEEMLAAAVTGVRRRILAIEEGRVNRYGWGKLGYWDADVESCMAELAASKAIGKYWTGISDSRREEGDLNGVEVRWTKYPKGKLILHPDDPDDRAYVLVRGLAPAYEIPGFVYGYEGKRQEFWEEPDKGRHCFMVPPESLEDLEYLIRDEAEKRVA